MGRVAILCLLLPKSLSIFPLPSSPYPRLLTQTNLCLWVGKGILVYAVVVGVSRVEGQFPDVCVRLLFNSFYLSYSMCGRVLFASASSSICVNLTISYFHRSIVVE